MSDIKKPVYRKIRSQHPGVFKDVSNWVYEQFESLFPKNSIRLEFREYLENNEYLDPLSQGILSAAHIYATSWEFRVIRNADPNSPRIQKINQELHDEIKSYQDLTGIKKLLNKESISEFIDLVGQLRFQTRWSQTPRIPATSVLGHAMMVAVLTYLFSREKEIGACDERIMNNFFGGLFHDLPEALTRDIISPVKGAAPELPGVISKIEQELVNKELYPLLPVDWHMDFKYFTEKEFKSKIRENGEIKMHNSDEINKSYNEDKFKPYDGEIIKACDHLAAFVEAYVSCQTGIRTHHLEKAIIDIARIYNNKESKEKNKNIVAGIDFGSIYEDF
jgi:putative hydrolase of HD superfamily